VTSAGTYSASRAIVAAGAWAPQLTGGMFAKVLCVYAQRLFWFAPTAPAPFAPGRFPIFIWRYGSGDDDHFYGFPVVTEGVKLATEQFSELAQPDAPRETPAAADAQRLFARHVHGRLTGVSDRCLRAATCLYTVTPDFGFLIDRHPDWEHVIVASPCSGHGFKHAAAVGEALAEWATEGQSRLDLAAFSLARLRPADSEQDLC
jgi:sarcosine oxidase